jgi:signal peptidase I
VTTLQCGFSPSTFAVTECIFYALLLLLVVVVVVVVLVYLVAFQKIRSVDMNPESTFRNLVSTGS